MLGSHSTSTGMYGLSSPLRQKLPNAISFPQHFAAHSYRTESLGKVFHVGHGNHDDPDSFSVPHFSDKVIEYRDPQSTPGGELTREEAYFSNQQLDRIKQLLRGAAFESPGVQDEAYADGRVARETVSRLTAAKQRLTTDGAPFFIVAGFVRPHLPFSAPKKYWDLYDPDQLPQPQFETAPKDAPAVAMKKHGELIYYSPVSESGVVDESLRRQLIHGYYASVSYVDAQIGVVLDSLKSLQLDENTIVVLWGDHGFHLGDHGLWTKYTNIEQANRIPLIMVAPGVTPAGTSTRQLAESVDVFPTLSDLADLPAPAGPQPIDGISLVPVLCDPAKRMRDFAYLVFPKERLGRALRTERHRLVEWRSKDQSLEQAVIELYHYEVDPLETIIIAANHTDIVAKLRGRLVEHPVLVWP